MSKEKDFGQFFTDEKIARFMVKWVTKGTCESILDPAVGPGIFMKMADKIHPKAKKIAFEIDPEMVKLFQNNHDFKTDLSETDYLYSDLKEPADAIVCNPPYNKFQKIPEREKLRKVFADKYGITLSGYTNYCIYFLLKSLQELKKNGRLAYIIPYEFLNTGYGEAVKEYLIQSRYLKTIIKFDNQLKLFEDAITTSCILLAEKKIHKKLEFVSLYSMEDLERWHEKTREAESSEKAAVCNSISYEKLNAKEKWLSYFANHSDTEYNEENLVPFSKIGTVKRGIATGNNEFFTLSREKIKKYGLSKSVCVPCIAKSPDVNVLLFDESEFLRLEEENRKVYLFNGKNAVSKADKAYIKSGEENGVQKGYLTAHRTPWYAPEEKAPAPIWISVFSRSHIKVVRNEAMIKNLTTFHGIYFNESVSKEEIDLFFCYLLTPIAQELLRKNKREYGEGLDKFEPGDLNNGKVLDIRRLSGKDKKKVLEIYSKIKQEDAKVTIASFNEIFLPYCKCMKGTEA